MQARTVPFNTVPFRRAIGRSIQTMPHNVRIQTATFPHTWHTADATLRASRHPSLTRLLMNSFSKHTLDIVGEFADSKTQDTAAFLADTCVSLIPLVNELPFVRELGQALAKKMTSKVLDKSKFTAFMTKCGTDTAVQMLALSIATFMMQQAHAWGSTHFTVEDAARVLLKHPMLTFAFVSGKDVSLVPLIKDLVPRTGANTNLIWKMIRSKSICAWCKKHCSKN